MPTAQVKGLNINYEVIGEDGPWVALVTGGRRGYAELVPLAQKIAANGYRVFLHDRRNTGASDMLLDDAEVEEAVWADDLHELLAQHDALPAFIGGSSAGARTAMLFAIRHPEAVRGLLLLRVTGGEFAAGRLPENYYNRFIRAAEEGGMQAVSETDVYAERIAANPKNRDVLINMDPQRFIEIMSNLRDLFVAGAGLPVMGVPTEKLTSMNLPVVIIPGNDKTHASANGIIAHELIPGSELHQLPIEDVDEPLVAFTEWAPYEAEITSVFTDFMGRVQAKAAAE